MNQARGTTRQLHLGRSAGRAAAALALAGMAYATWIEPRRFVLRKVSVPCLPAGTGSLRVLHLSDLHLVPRQRMKREWVSSLAALEPDLVVNTGDNLAHQEAVPAVLATFGALLDRPGVFVLGSNDYYAPVAKNPLRYLNDSHRHGTESSPVRLPTQDLIEGLTSCGWHDLTNRRAAFEVAGIPLEWIGVDDPHLHYDDYASAAGEAPTPEAALTIGVTHAPYQRILDAMVSGGAQLVFAGHTHGGQVRLPGIGALVTNCDLDAGRAAGLSRWWPGAGKQSSKARIAADEDAAWLHVSAGLGGNPFTPFRFCCRPEATLATLTERQTAR